MDQPVDLMDTKDDIYNLYLHSWGKSQTYSPPQKMVSEISYI